MRDTGEKRKECCPCGAEIPSPVTPPMPPLPVVIHGSCILNSAEATESERAICQTAVKEAAKAHLVGSSFLFLLGEVERYIEKPGCNQPARVTAMERLKWAVEEAQRRMKA